MIWIVKMAFQTLFFMAKNEFHACTQAKSFSFALFFPLPFFSISGFVAHLIFFLLHGTCGWPTF